MGMAKNIVAVQPTVSVLASNNSYYHPADGVFYANILLSHAICPSLIIDVA